MAMQLSGTITFQQIQDEFLGVHPISLSEYRGVGAGPPGQTPVTGPISLSQFYGKQRTSSGGGGTGGGLD